MPQRTSFVDLLTCKKLSASNGDALLAVFGYFLPECVLFMRGLIFERMNITL
jgi:hypothetical protein